MGLNLSYDLLNQFVRMFVKDISRVNPNNLTTRFVKRFVKIISFVKKLVNLFVKYHEIFVKQKIFVKALIRN